MINKSASYIKNEAELQAYVHSIHNLLRNHGYIGMNAYRIFSMFYSLKLLEESIKKGIMKLPDVCLFSELVKTAQNSAALSQMVFFSTDENDSRSGMLEYLWNNEEYKNTIFNMIPRDMDINLMARVIQMINRIDIKNSDIAGRTYEYFIGPNTADIGELGAYYTNCVLAEYIVKKVNPIIKNGYVPDICDPFCGSGRFLTCCINIFKKQYPDIDWSKQLMHIHGYEINEDMVKSCNIELISLTNTLPYEKGVDDDTCIWKSMNEQNSFKDGDQDGKKSLKYEKYDYVFSNPPYGGDKQSNKNNSNNEFFIDTVTRLEEANGIIKHVATTGSINIQL